METAGGGGGNSFLLRLRSGLTVARGNALDAQLQSFMNCAEENLSELLTDSGTYTRREKIMRSDRSIRSMLAQH